MSHIINIRDALHQLPLSESASKSMISRVDVASATVTYVGEALPGTGNGDLGWKIKRISVSGDVTSINFADGSIQFDKEWDERANYTY